MTGPGQRLGRGLSALLGEDASIDADSPAHGPRYLPTSDLMPGPFQPRRDFANLDELAASIRARGILQPILVRPNPEQPGLYEIIAGERRWRAAQMVQLHEVPVVQQDMDDRQVLEVALIENLQRDDLGPIEEALAYERLLDQFGHTQEALATSVGRSRSHIANTLRLLGLPAPVRDMLTHGQITAGHARPLVGLQHPETVARQVVEHGLSVRDTEKLARKAKKAEQGGPGASPAPPTRWQDPDTAAWARDLSNHLGLQVRIRDRGKKGTVTIRYTSLEQLDDLLNRLTPGQNPGEPATGDETFFRRPETGESAGESGEGPVSG